MIPASLQPAVTTAGKDCGCGTTIGEAPSVRCAARASSRKRRMKGSTSILNAAASRKIWMSPIQPIRSSRCGQSVGTEKKRSEEHTSELQSLMRISYAVFCLKKKKNKYKIQENSQHNHEHTT